MKKRCFFLFSFLLFVIPQFTLAQKQAVFEKDFFLHKVQRMKDDTNKVNAYAANRWMANPEKAEEFYKPALALAQRLHYFEGTIKLDLQLASFSSYLTKAKSDHYVNDGYQLALKYHFEYLRHQALIFWAEIDERNKQYAAAKIKIDSCINYFEKEHSQEGLDKIGAIGFRFLSHPELSQFGVAFWQNKLIQYKKNHDDACTKATLNILAQYYTYYKPDYIKAIKYKQQQLEFYRTDDTSSAYRDHLEDVGFIYESAGNYAKALGCYKQLSTLKVHAIDVYSDEVVPESLIADIYSELADYPSAIKYRLTALQKMEQANNIQGAMREIDGIAYNYAGEKRYTKALGYLNYGLKLSIQAGDNNEKTRILGNMVNVNYHMKNYGTAISLSREQFKTDTLPFSYILHQTNFKLGSIYRDAPAAVLQVYGINPAKRYELSLKKLTGGLAYFKTRKFVNEQSDAYKELSLTYYKKGEYKKAYNAYNNYQLLRDSSNSRDKQKAFRQKEAEYTIAKETDSLKFQQQLINTRLHDKQVQSYYFMLGSSYYLRYRS